MNKKKIFVVLCMLLFAQIFYSQQVHHVIVSIEPCILEEEEDVIEEEVIVDEEEDIVDQEEDVIEEEEEVIVDQEENVVDEEEEDTADTEDIVDEGVVDVQEGVNVEDIDDIDDDINNPDDIRTLVAYPSPASALITIESVYPDAEILMMDAMGRVVYKGNLNNGRLDLDTNKLAPGVYRINLRTVEVNKLINILVK